ncbi:MAG: hypothetical protein J6128_07430 [Clostridia bacterium]|nr:hypothetical protein [Clostridia bacterium]
MKNTNSNSNSNNTSASKTSLSRGALMLAERMNSYADDESKVRYGCRLFISGKKLMSLDMKATYKCVTDGDNATLDDVNNAGWLMYRMAGLLEYPRCLDAYSVWFDYDSPKAFRKNFEDLFSVLRPVVERVIDENTDWEKLRASLRK